jgi:ABC-2 type transport system permease protein
MNALAPLGLMLRHEARIGWRQMTARTSSGLMLGTLVGLLVFAHLLALIVPFAVSQMPPLPQITVLAGFTVAGTFAMLMMISVALVGAVKFIYSRGDMDLLLSSPVEPQAIVFARILTIALGMFGMLGLLVLPVANVMAAFGHLRFLVAYVVLLNLALAATAIGVLMAQAMFAVLGARRTRLFAQIFAGVLSIGFLILVNLPNLMSGTAAQNTTLDVMTRLMPYLPGADSWVWLPARAMLGEPSPFLLGVVLCTGLFVAVTCGLANRLIANAIAASSAAGKAVKTGGSSRALAPVGGPVTVMRRKEWLLIGRDPWLMTQIAQQLLVILPAIFLMWKSGTNATYMWLVVVFLAGNLAGALAWLAVSTEEAADLLATAPLRPREVLWAKLQAALIPTAALAAVPVMLAVYSNLWVGFTILLCGAGNALSAATLHVRNPSTAKRSELAWRGSSNKLLSLVEFAIGLGWVAIGLLMIAFGAWGMLALIAVVPFAIRVLRS